jgi:hypothetical protein
MTRNYRGIDKISRGCEGQSNKLWTLNEEQVSSSERIYCRDCIYIEVGAGAVLGKFLMTDNFRSVTYTTRPPVLLPIYLFCINEEITSARTCVKPGKTTQLVGAGSLLVRGRPRRGRQYATALSLTLRCQEHFTATAEHELRTTAC